MSKKVNYNYKNIDNINYYDASSIDISFVSKNENISFDYIFKRNTITPIEIDNLKKINILTFEYE